MAVEAKRGCGYRKVGGTYLVGGGVAMPCDRLPVPLEVCPCCGQGIKQARGWTWVDVDKLVQGPHNDAENLPEQYRSSCFIPCPEHDTCPLCGNPESLGRAGLLWVGAQFYQTPEEFVAEGVALGFSRRIKAVPRGFKVGETWVLLAHPKAVKYMEPAPGAWTVIPEGDLGPGMKNRLVYKPGIFHLWRPTRVEKILPESTRGSGEAAELEKRGVTPVFVPDGDPDHRGSAYDRPEEPGLFGEAEW